MSCSSWTAYMPWIPRLSGFTKHYYPPHFLLTEYPDSSPDMLYLYFSFLSSIVLAYGFQDFVNLFFNGRENATPRQMSCVLTFLSSTVLSVMALHHEWEYQKWFQHFLAKEAIGVPGSIHYLPLSEFYSPFYQSFSLCFYCGYIFADTVMGYVEYPQNFPLLESKIHHLFTFLFMLDCILTRQFAFMNMIFIVEISTVFLMLGKMFPQSRVGSFCKKKLFPPMFFICRLVWIFYLFFYRLPHHHHYELDPYLYFMFFGFSGLNIHWFSTMVKNNKIVPPKVELNKIE